MEKPLKLSQVEDLTTFKKTKIYKMIKGGTFPPPKKFGKASRWFESQVEYAIDHQKWDENAWQKIYKAPAY